MRTTRQGAAGGWCWIAARQNRERLLWSIKRCRGEFYDNNYLAKDRKPLEWLLASSACKTLGRLTGNKEPSRCQAATLGHAPNQIGKVRCKAVNKAKKIREQAQSCVSRDGEPQAYSALSLPVIG